MFHNDDKEKVDCNKTIIKEFVNAINAKNWNKLDELVATDFVRHSYAAGEPEISESNFGKSYRSLRRSSVDYKAAVKN